MKVLITGSSGYFGSILGNFLVSQKIPVVGIDIRQNPDRIPAEYYSFHNCNITDKKNLNRIFNEEQPTHVVHFACTFNKLRNKKKEHFIDVGGSENILDAANITPSVRQVIFSSSAAVYGGYPDNPEWIKEIHESRPGKYSYGCNKKVIEQIYLTGSKREDLKVIVTRICTLTGPSYSSERVLLRLISKFPYLPEFYRSNRLQLLHEQDFVLLMTEILKDQEVSGIYNMASDTYSYVYDLVPGKKFFKLPKNVLKYVLWMLWNLKILNLSPASINTSIYPVILDPSKLKDRYNYKFRYSTSSAFSEIHNSH
jgi:nucleoside-diphosphate-sugar epimerase